LAQLNQFLGSDSNATFPPSATASIRGMNLPTTALLLAIWLAAAFLCFVVIAIP
jgi:hypothetical protein